MNNSNNNDIDYNDNVDNDEKIMIIVSYVMVV